MVCTGSILQRFFNIYYLISSHVKPARQGLLPLLLHMGEKGAQRLSNMPSIWLRELGEGPETVSLQTNELSTRSPLSTGERENSKQVYNIYLKQFRRVENRQIAGFYQQQGAIPTTRSLGNDFLHTGNVGFYNLPISRSLSFHPGLRLHPLYQSSLPALEFSRTLMRSHIQS